MNVGANNETAVIMIQPGDPVSFDGCTGHVVSVKVDHGNVCYIEDAIGNFMGAYRDSFPRVTIEAIMPPVSAATCLVPSVRGQTCCVCSDPLADAMQAASRLPVVMLMRMARQKIESEIKP